MIAKVGSFRSKATAGSMTFDTGLGVTPDCLYLLIGPPAATGTKFDGVNCGHGWADSHGNQYGGGFVLPWLSDYGGVQHDWANAESTSQAIFIADWAFPAAQVVHCAATITSLNSDGTVDLNFTDVDGGGVQRTIGFLALSGVDAIIGSFAWSSGTVTVNPWSPNKTPTWVSMMVRPSTGLLGMSHAPNDGTCDKDHFDAPTTARNVSGNLLLWEDIDGNGTPRGVYATTVSESHNSSLGGVLRPNVGDTSHEPRADIYRQDIVTNGFTVVKSLNNEGTTLTSMHYMAVKVTDATVFSQRSHIPGVEPGGSQHTIPHSDLTAQAVLGAYVQTKANTSSSNVEIAGWGFADPAGNQVCLYASCAETPPGVSGSHPVEASCGMFTDRVGEMARGTFVTNSDGNGTSPFEYGAITMDLSDPDNLGTTFTGSGSGADGFLIVGPKKTTRKFPQIIRYR